MSRREQAYLCGSCRERAARVYEHALPWPDAPCAEVRLVHCHRCRAAKLLVADVDPWRGPELEAIALRPSDRAAAASDWLVAAVLDAFGVDRRAGRAARAADEAAKVGRPVGR